MPSEVERYTSFERLRYAQCWEDAAILLQALQIQPHHTCLSIASGGDNSLALLTQNPQRIIAIDLSPAQIACLDLKVAAYRVLSHPELLIFLGARRRFSLDEPVLSARQLGSLRRSCYERCWLELKPYSRLFWDQRSQLIAQGILHTGKFERYLATFRRYLLPLIHSRSLLQRMLSPLPAIERKRLYAEQWDTWWWRSLFRCFFSTLSLGNLGTAPGFLRYAEQDLAEHLLARTRYALIELDPVSNPYLFWIAHGEFGQHLPIALQAGNFNSIQANLDRLEYRCIALEDYLLQLEPDSIQSFNLSNVFEFMSPADYAQVLSYVTKVGSSGARVAYWNRLATRQCPVSHREHIRSCSELARSLYSQDQVFFYSRFVIEEVI